MAWRRHHRLEKASDETLNKADVSMGTVEIKKTTCGLSVDINLTAHWILNDSSVLATDSLRQQVNRRKNMHYSSNTSIVKYLLILNLPQKMYFYMF